jgi:DNA primase
MTMDYMGFMQEVFSEALKIANTDTYHLISRYVELTTKGDDYTGKCPFCGGNQFNVSSLLGMYYCFDCCDSNSTLMFLAKMQQNISPMDVARDLIEEYREIS